MVTCRVGVVAYQLALPEGSHIHNVVHVSQLKPHLPTHIQVSDLAALTVLDSVSGVQPVGITASRCIQRGGVAVQQIQVAWDTTIPPTTSWEDAFAVHAWFPEALA
jgi:hypothetical protein